jgi:hypothetical protein
MSKLSASLSASGSLIRLRGLAVIAAAAIALSGCASGGLSTLSTPSLAPADKPLAEASAAPAAAAPAPAIAAAANAAPVPIYLDPFQGGAPAAINTRLHQKVEQAFAKRNVNVVRNGAAYRIKGTVTAIPDAKGTLIAYVWDVTKGGKRLKRASGELSAGSGKGGDAWSGVGDDTLDKLAATAADQLSDWMVTNGDAPVADGGATVQANRVASASATSDATPSRPAVKRDMLVLVTPVSGSPGDGNTSLTSAMRNSLRAKGIKLTSSASDAVYQVRGLVEVGTAASGQQPIKIDWRIYAPNGKRLDHVVQKNKLPAGAVDGAWGEVASLAADGAADDIILVLSKSGAQM